MKYSFKPNPFKFYPQHINHSNTHKKIPQKIMDINNLKIKMYFPFTFEGAFWGFSKGEHRNHSYPYLKNFFKSLMVHEYL